MLQGGVKDCCRLFLTTLLLQNSVAPRYSSHRTIKTVHYRRSHRVGNHLKERQLTNQTTLSVKVESLGSNTGRKPPYIRAQRPHLAEFFIIVTAEQPNIPRKPIIYSVGASFSPQASFNVLRRTRSTVYKSMTEIAVGDVTLAGLRQAPSYLSLPLL